MPLFTILLPVMRSPELLPFAVESVLAQTIGDWELFIVGDGAPRATAAAARTFEKRDPRIKARMFRKGERNGEQHRHAVLREGTGTYVAHIGDDDIWFPNHLAELERLLREVDFGNLLQCEIEPGGRTKILLNDLANPAMRCAMVESLTNFFGPTVAGYRRAAYDRLSVGWSPAPPDVWSDLHMWRKFLSRPDITAATRFSIASVKLAAHARNGVALEHRRAETAKLAAVVATPEGRTDIVAAAWHNAFAGRIPSPQPAPPSEPLKRRKTVPHRIRRETIRLLRQLRIAERLP
jgi:glycosyltransferase involved in cell wall biosynthesis